MSKTKTWSNTGTIYQYGEDRTYEHISVAPRDELISTCNGCGRAAYERVEQPGSTHPRFVPNGLELAELQINPNGFQTTVIVLCRECAKQVRDVLFHHSAC